MSGNRLYEAIQVAMEEPIKKTVHDMKEIIAAHLEAIQKKHEDYKKENSMSIISQDMEFTLFTDAVLKSLIISLYGEDCLEEYGQGLIQNARDIKKLAKEAKKKGKKDERSKLNS